MKISEIRANREYNKILYTVYFTPNLLGKIFNIKNKTVGFYYAGFKHSLTIYGYTIIENGSNAYIYVDNVKSVATAFTTTPTYAAQSILKIGANTYLDNFWYGGLLDNIRIYNRALSDAEVLNIYSNEL